MNDESKPDEKEWTPLSLAQHFHNLYERAAPEFGYETRTETRAFDPESSNGKLMIAVCSEILRDFNAAIAAQAYQHGLAHGETLKQLTAERERVKDCANQIDNLQEELAAERERASCRETVKSLKRL